MLDILGSLISVAERVDETKDYIRIRQFSPSKCNKEHYATIDIDKEKGIKAIICRTQGKDTTSTQSYLFDRSKWNIQEAKKWLSEHNKISNEEITIDNKKMTYQKRKNLPDTAFVYPKERKYPIHDIAHARNALARVNAFGTPEERKKVHAAVCKKYPEIESCKEEKNSESIELSLIPDFSFEKTGGLMKFSGYALAAGIWRGLDGHTIKYEEDILKKDFESIVGARVKDGHTDDQDKVIGWVHKARFDKGKGIHVTGYIFDNKTILELGVNPTKKGLSVEMTIDGEPIENDMYLAKSLIIKRLGIVPKPACHTCFIEETQFAKLGEPYKRSYLTILNDIVKLMEIKLPFAGYKDFDDCVKKNQDKETPEKYCGSIKHKVEQGDIDLDEEKLKSMLAELVSNMEKKIDEKIKVSNENDRIKELKIKLVEALPEWKEPDYLKNMSAVDAEVFLKEKLTEATKYAEIKKEAAKLSAKPMRKDELKKIALETFGVDLENPIKSIYGFTPKYIEKFLKKNGGK